MSAYPTGDRADVGEAHEPYVRRVGYHQFLEFAADGLLVTDGQGLVIEANQAAAMILGCPKEFLLGKPLGLFVAAGERSRFYESLSRLHARHDSDQFEARVGRRDGSRCVVMWASILSIGGPADRFSFRWVIRDMTEQRRAEEARQELLNQLMKAQEDERRRVARELHDSFGQLLSALLLGIRAVKDAGPIPPAALERLEEVQRLAHELGRASHDLAVRLRPTALDDVGLDIVLGHHLEDWSSRTGIQVEFQTAGLTSMRLPTDIETTLFRIVQETLTNVVKHASAGRVSVVVEKQDGHAIAIIEDDGVGFDTARAATSGRLGLIGMHERLALLGGRLEIESSPGSGTTLIARIPLPHADKSEAR
jgi:PAS domain S-box-containing protein